MTTFWSMSEIDANILRYYPDLAGSHGKIRIRLSKTMLDQLCDSMVHAFRDRIQYLRITPSGENRFQIAAELSNRFFQSMGSISLKTLREAGVEFQISCPSASRKKPKLEGSVYTTLLGRRVAMRAVSEINDGLKIRNVVAIEESARVGFRNFHVLLSMNPFALLEGLLPHGMGHHITKIGWKATAEEFQFDLSWKHTGTNPNPGLGKMEDMMDSMMKYMMDDKIKALVENLIKTQFAEFKGSWASLHLQIPEKTLNEIIATAIASQKAEIPLLGLVVAARIRGPVNMDIKLGVGTR